ncbi:MAG: response regulator [Fluviicola sp.]|nr:response regulator [Fluviicola sp.]
MKIDNKTIMKYSKNLNVLYIEDNEMLRNSTLRIFNTYFNIVDIAEDGAKGLAMYMKYKNETAEYYDIVITDINMPNMNGIEMSQLICLENNIQSLIFITAYNDSSYLQNAIDISADGFLSKPIIPEQIQTLLYKVSKAISDSKEITIFFNHVEKLNFELENQNAQLKKKNEELEKSYRMLNTLANKDQITSAKKKQKTKNIEEIYLREQMQQFVNEDLQEIKDLYTEIDSNVISVINSNGDIPADAIEDIMRGFTQYASLLSFYTFFTELAAAMKDFAVTLRDNPLPDDKQKINDIFVLLESFLFVLNKWNKDLENSDDAVSFFDASIISDMNTITIMWTMSDTLDEEEDVDDMFF